MRAVRRERAHSTGITNRQKGRSVADGPIDFDPEMRGAGMSMFSFKLNSHVPLTNRGEGNYDFSPKLPGHTYRQPNASWISSTPADRLRRTTRQQAAATLQTPTSSPARTSPARFAETAGPTVIGDVTQRQAKQRGHKVAPRWRPDKWHNHPSHDQAPLQKDEGEAWNSRESTLAQGEIKGQDRLFRAVRTNRAEDVKTPESGFGHPSFTSDTKEYYPGRNIIDSNEEIPGGDFQVRPVHLPDFANPPPPGADPIQRMKRIREVMKQRYAGRMGLMGVFRSCAIRTPGYVFPEDLGQIFDQMGIKITREECDLLVKAVDKDGKNALAFEEFAELIYGREVKIGGSEHEVKARHVRTITRTLADTLITVAHELGKAFCELDPERHFVVNKDQFAAALGSAQNQISAQAVDFLWASQFPGEQPGTIDDRVVDWREFMAKLATFSHDNRVSTPCCVQGRKRQYDLLQRTAPITKGQVPELDLCRPEQDPEAGLVMVGGHLIHQSTKLDFPPRQANLLSESYVEDIRVRAERADRSLASKIPRARLESLLKEREMVHQDELIELLVTEVNRPGVQEPLKHQVPLYAGAPGLSSSSAQVEKIESAPEPAGPAGDIDPEDRLPKGSEGGLKLFRADIESYVATQKTNRDHEVKVSDFIEKVYKPEHEKKAIDVVNDGLNRALRKHRPPRERPQHGESGEDRYENEWQARHMFETLADNIGLMEVQNGGKLKASRIFKLIDIDGDGYVSLSDLRSALEKYKVLHTSADLHAMLTRLDPEDHGAVNIGEFTRNFILHQGSMIDNMQKTVSHVYHEGGVAYHGETDEAPDGSPLQAGARSSSSPPGNASASAAPSPMLRGAGASIVSPEQAQMTIMTPSRTAGRVSDVMRGRFSAWKAEKHELWSSPPKSRYGLTLYPDTRHVIEADMPMSSSFLAEDERFKTTNQMHSIFSPPDYERPQIQDDVKRHARGEFRAERARDRQREFTERSIRAEEAANTYDEMKIARKALNVLSYERKCRASCI